MKTRNRNNAVLTLAAIAMVTTVLTTTSAHAAIVSGDLTNYWKLDGNLTDSVGGSNGTLVDQDGGGNNTSFATGFDGTAGGALNFSGTTDHVSTALVTPTGAKSMSLFFTTTNTDDFQTQAGSHGNQRFYVAARGSVQ